MIGVVLKFIRDELNTFLREKLSTPGTVDNIVLDNIVNRNGENGQLPDNVIVESLINIEEERKLKEHDQYRKQEGKYRKFNPTQKLNLMVLFGAHFEDYETALKYLSETILFFEVNRFFSRETHDNFPNDTGLNRFTTEMYTLNFEELNQLWSSLGAKYIPSVVFKIRAMSVVDIKEKGSIEQIQERIIRFPDPTK